MLYITACVIADIFAVRVKRKRGYIAMKHFLSRQGALKNHALIFSFLFLCAALFSAYFVFATQATLTGTGTIAEDLSSAINFTLNNTESAVNVTNFTIFLSGAFNFSTINNGSALTAGVTGFPRVSSATVVNTYIISWENTTDGLANRTSGGNRSFGINLTVVQPGQYTITTNVNYSNGSVESGSAILLVTDATAPIVNVSYPSANHTNFTGAAENITAESTDNYNVSVTGVYAALKNYTGYYNLNGVLAGNTSTNWTNLVRSGSSSFFNNTLNANAFTDGIYALIINSTDNASNMAGNSSLNITIDNTAPVLFYGGGTTSDGINTTSNSITLNVTWNETSYSNMTFYLYSPGVTVNTSRTHTNTTNITNFSGLADGVYLFSVIIRDSSGNAANTTNQSVTIDATAPVINVTYPSTHINFTGAAENITSEMTDVLGRNVSDAYAALKNATGYYNFNGILAGTNYQNWTNLRRSGSTNFFNNTLNSSGFADMAYTLHVNTSDFAGTVAGNSSVAVTIDNTNPAVFYGGGTTSDGINTTSNSITVNVTWNETNYANMTFYLYSPGVTVNTSRTHTNTTNITNFSGLADGVYLFSVIIRDSSGNVANTTNQSVTVDATTPIINTTYPATHLNFTGAAENITAEATDFTRNISDVYAALKNATGYYNLNGVLAGTNYQNWTNLKRSGSTAFFNNTLNSNAFAEMAYTLHVNTSDFAGTVAGNSSVAVTIDNTAPVLAYSYNTKADQVNATLIFINVTWNETNYGNLSFFVYNSSSIPNLTRTHTNTTNHTNFTVGLVDFTYNFSVTIIDAAGNKAVLDNRTVTVDNSSSALGITVPSNSNASNITSGTANLTVSINETNQNVSGMFASLYNATGFYKLSAVLAGSNPDNWTNLDRSGVSNFYNNTLSADNFADGIYTLYINVTDNASNGAAAIRMNISIDNEPLSDLVTPSNGTSTENVDQTFTCNQTDATQLNGSQLYIYDATNGTLLHSNTTLIRGTSNSTSFFLAFPYRSTFYWTCNATDNAGNVNNVSRGKNTIVITGVTPPGSGSSGGGGGGGGAATTTAATYDAGTLSTGKSYTKELSASEKVQFMHGNDKHTLSISGLTSNAVVVQITSTPIIKTISKGQSVTFDFDNDKIDDLVVSYDSYRVSGITAYGTVTLKALTAVAITPVLKPVSQPQTAQEQASQPASQPPQTTPVTGKAVTDSGEESAINGFAFLLLIGVIIGAAVLIVTLTKYYSRSRFT